MKEEVDYRVDALQKILNIFQECFMGNETDPNFQEDVYDCLEGCVRYS